jgi:hypothetical protein
MSYFFKYFFITRTSRISCKISKNFLLHHSTDYTGDDFKSAWPQEIMKYCRLFCRVEKGGKYLKLEPFLLGKLTIKNTCR